MVRLVIYHGSRLPRSLLPAAEDVDERADDDNAPVADGAVEDDDGGCDILSYSKHGEDDDGCAFDGAQPGRSDRKRGQE